MNTTRNLLVAGVVAAFCCSIGNAQTVYSQDFSLGSSGVNLWTTAPTVANNYAGGSTSATWNDALGNNDTGALNTDGSDTSSQPTSWTLPFTPQSGYLYDLTASLTFTGNPGTWVGLGFAQRNSVNVPVGYGRYSDSGNGGPNGYDWMIVTEGSGNLQTFLGPHGTGQLISQNGFFTPGPQTLSLEVVLDTRSALWSVASSVNSVAGPTGTYTTNPTIGAVGITQNALSAPANVQWNNLTLTATPVPEPSTPVLVGAALSMLLLVTLYRKRQRDAAGQTPLQ